MRKREYVIYEKDFQGIKGFLDGSVFWKKFGDKVRVRLVAPNQAIETLLNTITQNSN